MKLQEGNVFRHVWLFTDGSHVTITHDALNFTIEEPPGPGHPPGHGTSLYQDPPAPHMDMRPHCMETPAPHLLLTSGGQDWRSVKTVSLENSPHPVLTSGGYCSTYSWQPSRPYASYWNTVLFKSKSSFYFET